METIGTPLLLGLFLAFILGMLALDLGVFHRREHQVGPREATIWTLVWIALSLAFNLWVYLQFGPTKGLEFFTGYVIEKALSIDNIFVFIVIFRYFSVRPEHQHRILFWGILGALVLRGIFIVAGTALLARFDWIILVFGAFLVYTGFKILRAHETEVHPEKNPILKLFRRFVPMTSDYHGKHFFVRESGRLLATPLLLVLVVVEATDVVFAVDSIPAIFGITHDPFIVFTSNIFAILGLRALYFLLAGLMHKFRYLSVGLGLVLVFIGVKMLIHGWVEIPIVVSLGVVAFLLGGSVLLSLLRPAPPEAVPDPLHEPVPDFQHSPAARVLEETEKK
ncbi:MAG TPA: TerC family protein [Thermoanaerobaculia bacterium]|nr:TerC family protein [Thermoanaerobaculia bacterium]